MKEEVTGMKMIFENLPNGVVVTEGNGKILHHNKRLLELLDYGSHEAFKLHVKDQSKLLFEDMNEMKRIIDETLSGDLRPRMVKFRRNNGSFLLFKTHITPYDDEDKGEKNFIWTIEEPAYSHSPDLSDDFIQDRFKKIYDDAPVGIVRTNPEGEILLINNKAIEILGYDHPNSMKPDRFNIADFYANKSERGKILDMIRVHGVLDLELDVKNRNSEIIKTHIVAKAEKNDQGEIIYITAFVEELTEKYEMQRHINERQALLDSLINCMPFELFVTDLNSNIIIQNAFSLDFWGDLHGKNLLKLDISSSTKEKWVSNIDRIRNNESIDYDIEIDTENGSGYLHRVIAPFREEGRVKGAISFSFDITRRVQLEKKIRENESMLKAIISSLPNELWVVDNDGKVLMQSDFSIKKWGDFSGRNTSEFQGVDRDDSQWAEYMDRVRRGEVVDVETEVVVKGKVLHSHRILAPLLYENLIAGYVAISFDITQLKRLQAELEKHRDNLELLVKERTEEIALLNEELTAANEELNAANESLLDQRNTLQDLLEELRQTQKHLVQSEKMASIGTLTAGIAHEINNPVNFISSGIFGLEILLENVIKEIEDFQNVCLLKPECACKNDQVANEQYRKISETIEEIPEVLESMHKGIDRTTAIVNGLRSFSRLDAEEQVLASVNDIMDSTLTILHNKTRDRIVIIRNFEEIDGFYCYPGKLGQVFLNILMNAIQAIPDKGNIEVSSKLMKARKVVQISIKDDGVGMSDEVRSRIFDPFYTTKEVGEGTGLGLSIAHGIMEEHAGSIRVSSTPGKGTEFIISLPFRR